MLRKGLPVLSFVLMVVSLYLVFLYVPTEATMGIVQRIFYFHVPVNWLAFLAYGVVFVAGIRYLKTRDAKWDIIASSSAEIGLVFNTLMLITGSIWAKPVWGVWWTWDPRLTTALVLWINYVAYHLVRAYTTDAERGARFSAVIGTVGFVDVPIVAMSITLWRTQHPGPVIFSGGLAPPMLLTLIVGVLTFTALYFLILTQRIEMKKSSLEIERLKELHS